MKSNIILFLILLSLIIIFLIIIRKQTIDKFDNLESNLYTYDTCCTEKEKENCMTYGKTGVCNYYKNDRSCLCQNSF